MDKATGRIGGVIPGRQEQFTSANWHSGANKVMRPEIHPQTASNPRGEVVLVQSIMLLMVDSPVRAGGCFIQLKRRGKRGGGTLYNCTGS